MENIKYLFDKQRERRDHYFSKPTSWAVMRYDGRELPFQESRIPSNWWKTNYDPCKNAYYILLPESDAPVLQALGAKRVEAYQDSEDPLRVKLAASSFAPPAELIEYLSNEWRTDDQSKKTNMFCLTAAAWFPTPRFTAFPMQSGDPNIRCP